VTAISELKVTDVCRVSCAAQRSIYTRSWCPTLFPIWRSQKKKGTFYKRPSLFWNVRCHNY
jgi:hypothetical protein